MKGLTPKQKLQVMFSERLSAVLLAADPSYVIHLEDVGESGRWSLTVDDTFWFDPTSIEARQEITRELLDLVVKITRVVQAVDAVYDQYPPAETV